MIPDGFIALDRPSPFLQRIGPLHCHGSGHALRMGLHAQKHHLNARGLVHGGVLATLADIALGYAMHGAQAPPIQLVTASLAIAYLGSAREGDWIETATDIDRIGARMAFATVKILASGKPVARATGVFAVTRTEA